MCVCVPDESLQASSQPDSAALAQFNKSWAELTDWLTMLDNMVQNKRVVVADLEDIGDNIKQLKVGKNVPVPMNHCILESKFKTCA